MTASFVLREAFGQVPDDGVGGAQLLFHVRQLATGFLQEQGATGHVETREQVEKEDDGAADHVPLHATRWGRRRRLAALVAQSARVGARQPPLSCAHPVEVAPAPMLAGLDRRNDRVTAGECVRGGMTRRR